LSLSNDVPKKTWGVYALVLQKSGHRSKIYIGSCTSAKQGVTARFREYDTGRHIPLYVKKALDEGYVISRKVLLARCPLPEFVNVSPYRVMMLALEGAFACIFWAMYRRDTDYGFQHLCPWPMTSFTYDGLCSHNPFKEAIHGEVDLTEEQMQELADKDRNYGRVYHKRQRDEAAPEFKAAQAKANKKHRPKTQEKKRDAVARKLFYCAPCDHAAGNNGHLTEHKRTKKHIRIMAEYERQQQQQQQDATITDTTPLHQEQQQVTRLTAENLFIVNVDTNISLPIGEMKKACNTPSILLFAANTNNLIGYFHRSLLRDAYQARRPHPPLLRQRGPERRRYRFLRSLRHWQDNPLCRPQACLDR
jgi:hypothetical protein